MSQQNAELPHLTCCERGRRFVALRFEDTSIIDSIVDSADRVGDYLAWAQATAPAWTIFLNGPERGMGTTSVPIFACPFCQRRTPAVRLRAHPPQQIRIIVDGGYYCDTCAERLDACACLPAEGLWEAIADGTSADGAGDGSAGAVGQGDKDGTVDIVGKTTHIPPRTVTCAWCGNRYHSAVPPDFDRGLQGSHCASEVVQDAHGQWIVRSGYGSENDLDTYAFVAHPPAQPADPICDECILGRLHASDLAPLSPSAFRRPEDFAPRPAGLWRITQQIQDQAQQIVAMRRLVDVACVEHGPAGISHPIDECLLSPCELCEAVEAYQKFQRWTGERKDEGDPLDEIAAAKILRESARHLERVADFCERKASSSDDRASAAPSDPDTTRADDLVAPTSQDEQ